MMRLINKLTGAEMWVANNRYEEYLAAGRKPVAPQPDEPAEEIPEESEEIPEEPEEIPEEPEEVPKKTAAPKKGVKKTKTRK